MKLHILYEFTDGPFGGGNQFLKALWGELRRMNTYTEDVIQADVIIVNANPGSLPYLLRKLPSLKQPILVRLDGPIYLIRGKDEYIDKLLSSFIQLHATGIVFQSQWSKQENKRLFNTSAPLETVIHNAPDSSLFYPKPTRKKDQRIKIIATSWSHHWHKGFAVYQYLDDHLDWSKYSMTFVGNSPVTFKNIVVVEPLPSQQLADVLRQHDIYLTASQNDPCSNALIEALACGLPIVARNSGGHPELVKDNGVLFTNQTDIIQALNHIATNIEKYKPRIPAFTIANAAKDYLSFSNEVLKISHRRDSLPVFRRVRNQLLRIAFLGYAIKESYFGPNSSH